MPKCDGPPSLKKCPNDKSGKDVEACNGELWLCKECKVLHFPNMSRNYNNKAKSKQSTGGSVHHKSSPEYQLCSACEGLPNSYCPQNRTGESVTMCKETYCCVMIVSLQDFLNHKPVLVKKKSNNLQYRASVKTNSSTCTVLHYIHNAISYSR